jgi:hypothetical protein
VDIRFPPGTAGNNFFPRVRKGRRIPIAGEEYVIANITEDEVTLEETSNKKRTTIKYSTEP